MEVLPAADWVDPKFPLTGSSPFSWFSVGLIALHYTAAIDVPDGDPGESPDDVASFLRRIQRDYATSRGYSIGYNFCIDWLGRIWTLRGLEYRCAANKGWNHRTVAVLLLVDGANRLNKRMIHSMNALSGRLNQIARHSQRSPKIAADLELAPHSLIGATQCPGDGIRLDLAEGLVHVPLVPPPSAPLHQGPLMRTEFTSTTRRYHGGVTFIDTRANSGFTGSENHPDAKQRHGQIVPGAPWVVEVPGRPAVAHIKVTAITDGQERGHVRAYGDPAIRDVVDAAANYEQDRVDTGGVLPVVTLDGKLTLEAFRGPCHVKVSIWASES